MTTLVRGTSFRMTVLGLVALMGVAASACGSDDETETSTATGIAGTTASGGGSSQGGAGGGAGASTGGAGGSSYWWQAPNLRVVTYEFMEQQTLPADLTTAQIMATIAELGGADLLLCKGFHYYEGAFDESSFGYPRFRDKIAELVPAAHDAGIRVGVFGFVQRGLTYAGQPDYQHVVDVWGSYAQMGVDALFIDEESGTSGLDIPAECLTYADDLRSRFDLPVGIFLYGAASSAPLVAPIASHVDAIGEMAYSLYLDQEGDYNLASVTESWLAAAHGANADVGYWTGAGVFYADQLPGSSFWQERYGDRTLTEYFHDYLATGVAAGATGVFFHSVCRLEWWTAVERAQIVAGVRQVFDELAAAR